MLLFLLYLWLNKRSFGEHGNMMHETIDIWKIWDGAFWNPYKHMWLSCIHTFHGRLIPLKNSGIHMGRTTASFKSLLASSRSAMSPLY